MNEDESDEAQYQAFRNQAVQIQSFVSNINGPIEELVWFYSQRATLENLIKESNNDAESAAHPFRLFVINQNHFQLSMLAYDNLNAWLMRFNRESTDTAESLKHRTLATARLALSI
jgi:hypothetical protein